MAVKNTKCNFSWNFSYYNSRSGIKACWNIENSQKAQIKILGGLRKEMFWKQSWKFRMKSWDLSIINTVYEQCKVHKETISFFPAGDSLGWTAGSKYYWCLGWGMCSNTERYHWDQKKWLGKVFAVSAVSDLLCAPAGSRRTCSAQDHRSLNKPHVGISSTCISLS